jgi:3-isopropylmalate dehydrogenase
MAEAGEVGEVGTADSDRAGNEAARTRASAEAALSTGKGVSRKYVITHLPGDGVGPEVTSVARECVNATAARHGFQVEWRHSPLGGRHYLETGEVLPDSVLHELRRSDAILLGAVGTPDVPPGVLERGLLLKLRFELDLYINLRPSKLRPGVGGAVGKHALQDLDLIIVRENTEGLYAGAGGSVHRGTEFEIATEESLNTWAGVRRCVRYAAKLAAGRSGRLTLVHKENVLTHAGEMWHRIARGVAAEAGVELDYAHVDAACLWMVDDPRRFDVIVTDNLFGDILSDLGAALTGGLGLAPSGNLHPERTGPSVFEPVHGSAPDIAGKGIANPAGAVLSAGLMLDHLGEHAAAGELDAAVNAVLAAGAPESTGEWEKALLTRLTASVVEGKHAGQSGAGHPEHPAEHASGGA